MKLIPLFDKIIVKEIKQKENKTKSGIILPTSVKEQPIEAKVVAIGQGGKLDGSQIEMQIAVGDTVLFHKFSSAEFFYDNEEYLILRQIDVLCKLDKEADGKTKAK